MAEGATITVVDQVSIPVSALTLEGFRTWACSDEFPERGRIDFLAGSVEADMSGENLFTHGEPKSAISRALGVLIADEGLGHVFVDRARLSSDPADLSSEPDVVAVLWDTIRQERVRWVPSASQEPDSFIEMEGGPDLVVEVVSDGSVRKDTRILPGLYAKAGVPEFWLADCRGKQIELEIRCLVGRDYELQSSDVEGWTRSPLLGRWMRLTRKRTPVNTWSYRLEHAAAGMG